MNIQKMVLEGIKAEIERCQVLYEKLYPMDYWDLHDAILVIAKYDDKMFMEDDEVYEHFCKLLKKINIDKVNEKMFDIFYYGY